MVPRRRVGWAAGAVCVTNGEVLDTQGNVKAALVNLGCIVDHSNDTLSERLRRVEGRSVFTVSRETQKGDPSASRAAVH